MLSLYLFKAECILFSPVLGLKIVEVIRDVITKSEIKATYF